MRQDVYKRQARKNTFPDRKDSTVQDVTGSPKSAGKILKELGSVFFRTLATMFFVMVITGCIVACVMTVYIVGFLDDESDLDLNSLEMNYTSILYVQDKSTGEYMELNRLDVYKRQGVKMLEHQETPGFGAKLAEDSYGAGYVGKTASDYTEVDGVSGATITSKAYKKALGTAFELYSACLLYTSFQD